MSELTHETNATLLRFTVSTNQFVENFGWMNLKQPAH